MFKTHLSPSTIDFLLKERDRLTKENNLLTNKIMEMDAKQQLAIAEDRHELIEQIVDVIEKWDPVDGHVCSALIKELE